MNRDELFDAAIKTTEDPRDPNKWASDSQLSFADIVALSNYVLETGIKRESGLVSMLTQVFQLGYEVRRTQWAEWNRVLKGKRPS